MLLCEDFVKFVVQTSPKCGRDNSKVSTFLHAHLFIAFGSFLLVWTKTPLQIKSFPYIRREAISGGGLLSLHNYVFFCLQADGPITGRLKSNSLWQFGGRNQQFIKVTCSPSSCCVIVKTLGLSWMSLNQWLPSALVSHHYWAGRLAFGKAQSFLYILIATYRLCNN